jgi:hypothetical protein
MQLEQGTYCPLVKKDCVKLHCAWFVKIRGSNPNTGELIDEYDCAVKWLPILLIENSQQTRQAGAAIESFRNEMVKINQKAEIAITPMLRHSIEEHLANGNIICK